VSWTGGTRKGGWGCWGCWGGKLVMKGLGVGIDRQGNVSGRFAERRRV